MTTKYIIDLRQFNNGESDRITFPTFDQCLMYGMHKLRSAVKKKRAIIQAILIEDSQGRKIVVNPTKDEIESYESFTMPSLKVKFKLDPHDGNSTFLF